MTPSEVRFKTAVRKIVASGEYPTPKAIRLALGLPLRHRTVGGYVLDGRQMAWRRQVLNGLGWTEYTGPFPRRPRFSWRKP